MKDKLKVFILFILIVAMIGGIGFLIYNAVRSVKYNENAKNPIVTFDVEGYGQVEMELYPEYAPNTVKTIIKLVQNGFYDGKVFYGKDEKSVHLGMQKNETATDETAENTEDTEDTTIEKTAVEDVLRVSDLDISVPKLEAENTTADSPDYDISIEGEFAANDFEQNTLRFERGIVGLYRTNYQGYTTDLSAESFNSGKSLMFISTEEDSSLNGMYTAFGKVTKGMDIIENMKQLSTYVNETDNDITSTDNSEIEYFIDLPVITKATVNTFNVDYGMPKYQRAFDYNQYVSNLILQYYNNQ